MVPRRNERASMCSRELLKNRVPPRSRIGLEVPGEISDTKVSGHELDSPFFCVIFDELLILEGFGFRSDVVADMHDHARIGDAGDRKREGDRVRAPGARDEGPALIVSGVLVTREGTPPAQDPRNELVAFPVLGHRLPTGVMVPCIIHTPMIEWAVGE